MAGAHHVDTVAWLATAPDCAWRGDLLMVGAALYMALYSIWSKPIIRRSGPIPFTTLAMAAGAAVLVSLSMLHGSFATVEAFGPPQWLGALYLGAFGSALTFYLWAFALERTTPTRLAAGILTVFIGIWIATQSRPRTTAETDRALQEL